MAAMFPGYSSSSALSAAHYQLVTTLEAASATDDTYTHELDRVTHLVESSTSPKATKTALVMAMYMKSVATAPLDLGFCLPAAVKLAGGGKDASLDDRRIGYRACDDIFSEQPHQLKLLLINTIRSDLHAPTHSPLAEARWAMGLRAAASPRLVSDELVPAISDRVVELFASRSAPIRRLALAALLSLNKADSDSLLATTRALVLEALSPPLASPKKKPRRLETDPRVLAALVRASRAASPLHPTTGDRTVLNNLLAVLRRVVAGEWSDPKWLYHGVACGWLSAQVLEAIQEVISQSANIETSGQQVLLGVLSFLPTILDKVDLAFGLLLSSLSCLTSLPASLFDALEPEPAATLSRALATVRRHLDSSNPNLRILALYCLRSLPLPLWAGPATAAVWGEPAWARILGFLSSRDPSLRIATLYLLHHADPALAALHLTRLLHALAAHPPPSTTRTLVPLLVEASPIVDRTALAWAARLREIVATTANPSVLGPVVVGTIDRFASSLPDLQRDFAAELIQDEEGWKADQTLALLVAATAGGGSSDEPAREAAATTLSRWLASSDGKSELIEPFLIALLRQLARLPRSTFSKLAPSDAHLSSPLLDLCTRCETEVSSRSALEAAGVDARSTTLPGFLDALHDHLAREARPRASLESASSSAREKPLMYGAYKAAASPTSKAKGKERERERTERGGRGGTAEAVMTAGGLALLGVGEGYDEAGFSDGESDSSRAHFRRATRIGAPDEEVELEGSASTRRRASSGAADAPPPQDLLIEVAPASLDPFHNPT